MENIVNLQSCVKAYMEGVLADFYDFELWKSVLISSRASSTSEETLKLLDRFGDKFKPSQIFADVQASNDDWAPTLSAVFQWSMAGLVIPFRVIIIKDKVSTVHVLDAKTAYDFYGEAYDYVKQFEKSVIFLQSLRG